MQIRIHSPGLFDSFFADLDPAIFFNADPDLALQNCGVTYNFFLNIIKLQFLIIPMHFLLLLFFNFSFQNECGSMRIRTHSPASLLPTEAGERGGGENLLYEVY